MQLTQANTRELVIDSGLLALHVIKAMTTSHKNAHLVTLDGLTKRLRIRRADIRSVLSALHEEGMLDIATMQLTLEGFAIGCSLNRTDLKPLRLRLRPLCKAAAAA